MINQKVKISLPMQMIIGMILGIAVGFIAPLIHLDTATYLKPFGQLFISLIRMVVIPLVLSTIISGAAGIHDISKLGRVASKTIVYYFGTTAVAITIGLVVAHFLQPGVGLSISVEGLHAQQVVPPKLIDTILNIVPINPIDALAKGNMLQIIFFAVIFGFALSSLGEKGTPLLRIFELTGDVMIKMTGMVMMFAPIGVFGLMAFTVSQHGLLVLLPLAKLIGVFYLCAFLHLFICYIPLIKGLVGLSPKVFFKTMGETMLIAFTTCSSAASLPTNLQAVRRLGASKGVSSFSIPFGNTINMDGTAIYMAVCAVFAAEVFGIPLPFDKQLSILLLGLLASIGTAGVPGAGLIMISIVFTQVGIPLEAIALIAGVDRILDMARTPLNVMGDATGALVISKLEDDFGKELVDEIE